MQTDSGYKNNSLGRHFLISRYRELRIFDPKLYCSFIAAAKTGNFTRAGEITFTSQSNISQHIAKLEEMVGKPLFRRQGRSMLLTETGQSFMNFIKQHVRLIDEFMDEINSSNSTLSGPVSLGVPPGFTFSPYLSQLLEKSLQSPSIEIVLDVAGDMDIQDALLTDEIDIGVVSDVCRNPKLECRPFTVEEYVLVGNDESYINNLLPDEFPCQEFVHYPGSAFHIKKYLESLCEGHSEFLSTSDWKPYRRINSIEIALQMVKKGLCIGVFPRYCVESLLEDNTLFEYKHNKQPCLDNIYIVSNVEHRYKKRVDQVINWLTNLTGEYVISDLVADA